MKDGLRQVRIGSKDLSMWEGVDAEQIKAPMKSGGAKDMLVVSFIVSIDGKRSARQVVTTPDRLRLLAAQLAQLATGEAPPNTATH
jgi:hypothetical protein